MRIGLYLGWALLVGGFIAAAAELAAQAKVNSFGYMSAYDVLFTLFPGDVVIAKIRIERALGELVWDPLILTLLSLPGWLLLAAPGAVLSWRYRHRSTFEIDEQDDAHYSSYEDVVAAAEEADEFAEQEDSLPSKYRNIEEYDPTELDHQVSLERYIDEWDPADHLPDETADQPGFLPPTGRPTSPPTDDR